MERKIRVHKLENGLTVYSFFHPNSHCAGIGVKCGSLYERSLKVGVLHGKEHWITQRSQKYPDPREIRRLYRKYGGGSDGINVYTTYTHVFYGHSDVRKRDYMRKLLDIMASFLHPDTRMLESIDLPGEKGAIANEHYEFGKDVIDAELDLALYRLMYKKGPLAQSIDGSLETIETFTLEDVNRILRRWVVPSNMFLNILGPTLEEAISLGNRLFGSWQWDPEKKPKFRYPYPVLTHLDDVLTHEGTADRLHQHHMLIGFSTETHLSPDAEAIDMLAYILDDRLEGILRDDNHDMRKGVYHVRVNTLRTFVHGILSIKIASRCGEYIKHAEEVVLREVKRLREQLVSVDEFDAVQTHKLDSFLVTIRHDANGLGDLISHAAANGDENLDHLHDTGARIKRVTRKKLRDAANKYFAGYARVRIDPA